MTPKQSAALKKFRTELLMNPPETLDMRGTDFCAYDVLEKRHGVLSVNPVFGINTEEQRYLFAHAGNEYENPTGRGAAEEFADRAENLLQFHRASKR